MKSKPLHIGIAYNLWERVSDRNSEILSETSVVKEAEDVSRALQRQGQPVTLVPLRRSVTGFLDRLKRLGIDVLVNLCEGFRGRPQWESAIAGMLEIEMIPFTGNPEKALSLCQDKFRTKAVLSAAGLPTPPYALVYDDCQRTNLPFPLIVKPNREDASLGIHSDSVVHTSAQLQRQIKKVTTNYCQPALIETFIEGREFNVAVWENSEVRALPVSEIDFTGMPENVPHICGYEAKWFEDHILYHQTKPVCPAPLSETLQKRLQALACDAFRIMGCRDYARVDFRMGQDEEIFILEVNPNPDISLDAGFARALAAASISYEEFWNGIIRNAMDRKEMA